MRPLDTTAEAREFQRAVQREMGPDGRSALVAEMSEELRLVSLEGLRERHPDASEQDLIALLIELWHGTERAEQVRRATTAG